ncbi:hypothetical protein [Trinickia mobilis]|uniref:hypothetical protein n=1 Tax=Trinickia mobilis TaxID=2816356 RepID=UPI001A90235B|nr:hypothetical protein [Trinickia mobilis]
MGQYAFGSGALWGTASVANPTPSRFGGLQDVQLDFSATVKELYGQYTFPLTVARGTVKVTGKAKFAQMQGRLLNDLFFGGTSATGQINVSDNEAGTIPGTPYQVTVANSATWTVDLGVRYTLTGIPLTRVAAAPATGQYSVAAGVYTFAAADTGLGVLISYEYTVAATGQTITVGNPLLGVAPQFKPVLKQIYTNPAGVSQQLTLSMNAATSSKLSMATKLEDFMQPELDFACYCDASNTLCTLSLAEVN